MDLLKIPEDVRVKILQQLSGYELVVVTEMTCSKWRDNLVSASAKNQLWWRLCMQHRWEGSKIPKAMSKPEKRKNWKPEYVEIAMNENQDDVIHKMKSESRAKYKQDLKAARASKYAPVLEAKTPEWKEAMRTQYKFGRPKPRTKNKARDEHKQTEISMYCY